MFLEMAQKTLGEPWESIKDQQLAEEQFSLVMSEVFPDLYRDPMSWFESRAGTHQRRDSPEEVVRAIRDMLRFRAKGSTLFLVIDEVSQYVLNNRDRTDRLRAFASALGSTLRGKAWLLALGHRSWLSNMATLSCRGRRIVSRPSCRCTWRPQHPRCGAPAHPRQDRRGCRPAQELFDRHRADLGSTPTAAKTPRLMGSLTSTRCCRADRADPPDHRCCAPAQRPKATTRQSAGCCNC